MLEMTMMNVQANNVRQMVCWSVHCSLLFSIADRCKGRVGQYGIREMIILLISAIALSQSYIGIKVFYAGSSDISTITDLL